MHKEPKNKLRSLARTFLELLKSLLKKDLNNMFMDSLNSLLTYLYFKNLSTVSNTLAK